MSNAERFARLFAGFTARYGRYDMSGAKAPEEKVAGRARTVDEEIQSSDYAAHVNGEVGIGVIPLKTDNRVNFAAIDIDVYKQEDQRARSLTHSDVALTLSDTPLIVTKSKSGGIHVWLFSKEGVSARLATDYMNSQAARLGVAGCEVFPKQTERHSDDDVGNWINLPYFGNTRTAVIPNKVGTVYEFPEISLDLFLDIAEGAAATVTDDWLIDNTNPGEWEQRGKQTETPMFKDGPPCLQALCAGFPEKRDLIQKKFDRGEITEDQYHKQLAFTSPQLVEGARDNTFFNVALYLRRRMNEQDPDGSVEADQLLADLREAHTIWGLRRFGDDFDGKRNGIAEALPRLAAQAAKNKWGYSCTKEPLKGFCNRRLCLKRAFGIGTVQNDETAITGFTIVESEDRQYYMTIGDKRIHVPDAQTLFSQSLFAQIVLNQTDRMWRTMQDAKYKEMMDSLLQKADRIQPPPDSDRRSMLLNSLAEFISSKAIPKGKNDSSIHSGRVIMSEDELEATFKFDQFMTFLKSRGFSWTPGIVAKMLTDDLKVQARGNTHIGNKQVRPYVVNMTMLERMLSEGPDDGEA